MTWATPCCWCLNFYPRSPCGERQVIALDFDGTLCISIHALLAESDLGGGDDDDV